MNDGLFHHVVALRRSEQALVYVDAVLTATAATSGVTAITNNAECEAGWRTNFSGYWAGTLDDVRIYNRALDFSEIQAIYRAGANGMCAPTPLMFSGRPSYNKPNGFILNASLRSGQSYRLQVNTNITLLSVDAVFFCGTMSLCNGMKSFGNAA